MKTVLNPQTFLLITGLLQPVGASGIRDYLRNSIDGDSVIPDEDAIHSFLMEQANMKRLVRVSRNPDLFSLSLHGNDAMTRRHRLTRDKLRLYLLKDIRHAKIPASREMDAAGSDGAAPSLDPRPLVKGAAANNIGHSRPPGQYYWPLLSRQFSNQTGPTQVSRDTSGLPFLSFQNLVQVSIASGKAPDSLELDFSLIGVLMGVSPKLISQIARNPERHYRVFELPKRSGGVRIIESPRTFLKTIQFFLNDFFLSGLPVHTSVFSYRVGLGIRDNAAQHADAPFVGSIDIQNFFGSVSSQLVENLLISHNYGARAAKIISNLTTKAGALPQGAPTSPAISNALLFSFDASLAKFCSDIRLQSTRYADDITISGGSRERISAAIEFATHLLASGLTPTFGTLGFVRR